MNDIDVQIWWTQVRRIKCGISFVPVIISIHEAGVQIEQPGQGFGNPLASRVK